LGFKKILASEEHKAITQGFIKDFFGLEVGLDDIHIVNPYSIHAFEQQADRGEAAQKLQQTLRDITIEVVNADLAIEMQVHKEGHFIQRALYYLDDLYVSHYNDHQRRYMDLRPVWSMNLMGHLVFDDSRPLRTFSLRDDLTYEPLVPVLTCLGFFELTKTGTTPVLAGWRDFLLTGEAQNDDPSYIRVAADIIRWVNLSQEERDMDKLLEKALATQEAVIDYAREEGRSEGMQQGRSEGIEQGTRENQLANARVALRMGLAHADVAEITGLDVATVDRLAQEQG